MKSRELKFRVWDGKTFWTDNDDFWIQGGRTYYDGGGEYEFFMLEIENGIIQRFTGCLDHKSKEIYEGDVVRYEVNGKWKMGQILFERGSFVFDAIKASMGFGQLHAFTQNSDGGLKALRVVGNIFENPELLK